MVYQLTKDNKTVIRTQDNAVIPNDVNNRDWQAYQTWLLAGNISTAYVAPVVINSANKGIISSGTFTPNPTDGDYQYYTNNGAHVFANPTSDCRMIDILVTNGATPGTITFTTFTVGLTGDALTKTPASKFIISVRRINGVSTYIVKALQ